MTELDKEFWNKRYRSHDTGWDLGVVSPPLQSYFDQLKDSSIKILIPGCGNAYEGEYLNALGFDNVYLIDLSPKAIEDFKKRVPDFPADHLICGDFFKHQAQYDLIIEQTFFCALDPKLRPAYAKKMSELLSKGGKLVGLLFNIPLNEDKPPFGGKSMEYLGYFQSHFSEISMKPCKNSIQPRQGSELFIRLTK